MILDPETIIMMNIISTLLMSISLYAISRKYLAQIKGVSQWATATLIQFFGWLLISAPRGIVPEVISVVGGNALLLLCLVLYFNILAKFNNIAVRSLWLYFVVGLEAILLAYFVVVIPHVAIRIIVISVSSAFLLFACAYILLSKNANRSASHLLTAGMFIIAGIVMVLRFFYTLLMDMNPNTLPFAPYPMHSLTFLTFFITSVMLTFCFILMCNDKYIDEQKKTEEALRESENKFSLLAENATDIISLHDVDLNYLYITNSVKFTLGYDPEELIGKSISDYIHPDDIEHVRNRYLTMHTRTSIEYTKFRHKKKDGSYCWVESSANFTFHKGGKISGLVVNTRDISESEKAHEQVIKSEKQLNDAQQLAKIGSWEMNLITFELSWSKEHYRIFELEETPPDRLYEAYRSKIHPDDIPRLDTIMTNAIEQAEGFAYEHRVICKNGNIKNVVGIGEVIKDVHGKPIILRGTVQDFSQRKKDEEILRQSELRYRTLAEASEDMVFIISPKGTIEYLNEYAARQFSDTVVALTGKQMADLFPSTEENRRWKLFQKVLTSGQSTYQEDLTIIAGNSKWLGSNLVALKDTLGNITSVMGVSRDITEKKRSEQELIIAKEFAEKLASDKDRFLSNMSHEIRTPLNGIIGFTSVLMQSELTSKQKQQLEIIKTSGDILLVLVNDILDLAKMNEGKMTLTPTEFQLSNLVDTILATFELRIGKKELKVLTKYDKNIPQLLIGDPVRISQILINLINNSIKFTNRNGQLTVNVNLLSVIDKKTIIEFVISDTGIGIENEKLETIFDPFTQGNYDISNKYEGTGLGLSIVKRLVSLMNGAVSIKSKLNEGTTVTVTIPLDKAVPTTIPAKKEAVPLNINYEPIVPLKILLAEDNEINQLLAQTILRQFGWEVDTAKNGRIAIELLTKKSYDIILMDLKMPEMGGLEASKIIRTTMKPPKSTIPIIALTADITKSDIDKYNEVGINDYVIKPFSQADLRKKIIQLVKETKSKSGIPSL